MVSTSPPVAQNCGRQYLRVAGSTAEDISPNQQLLPVTATVNEEDHLEIGGCDVIKLVEQFGSPLYIVDEESLRQACSQYRYA